MTFRWFGAMVLALPIAAGACGGTTFTGTADGGTTTGNSGSGTGSTGGASGTGSTGTSGTTGTTGSSGTTGASGTSGTSSSGGTGGMCGGAHPAPTGRPSPVACPMHPPPIGNPDSGTPSCSSLSECTADYFYVACLHGSCSVDACITDSDCSAGQLCVCANQIGGGGAVRLGNECMTTQCRIDSDCGGGQVCSPSIGSCSSLLGYYCHTATDECLTDTDCCGTTPLCEFDTTKGHWACQTSSNACPG